MIYLQIIILFFMSILTIKCNLESENASKINSRFRRNINYENKKNNIYTDDTFVDKQNRKRSINNINIENKRNKRMVIGDFLARWVFPIPYFIDVGLSHRIIDSSLRMIERETCIRFKKFTVMKRGVSGLRYFKGTICFSPVGQQRGRIWQGISIGPGCETIGKIQHETLHSLGLFHEQSRFDRDKYLYFRLENADKTVIDNFQKVYRFDSRTYGIPFDFGSVMMYGSNMFSINGKDVMISYDYRFKATYGIADKISFANAKMLNQHYCSTKCPRVIRCFNGGYQNPNNCRLCKCVRGYIGPSCNLLSLPSIICGPSRLQATEKIQFFSVNGFKSCIYHILTENNKLISIKILASRFIPTIKGRCTQQNCLEVKYWTNKISAGARFCDQQSNILIFSHNAHVIIYFNSNHFRNYVTMLYKSIGKVFNPKQIERDFLKIQNPKLE
ncbi:Astacin-like metalloendopeptidase [Strongyloides ratti]|uniref:Metalloendopeptidase n=1 Tax=Strongyloides ratti TaxID=34506 RepID=A0A090LJM2_STRRB|nr:Astacin-like metalloendopeptidase [Strongyloides ratti]CEF70027.2 Astacin-like metalloendopeptidase [Strongyloides ratti]